MSEELEVMVTPELSRIRILGLKISLLHRN